MAGLQSFEDFTRLKAEKLAAAEAQKQTEAREETARSFKDLLAEYGVTKVSELDEEQRGKFFSRLEGTDLNESLSLVTEGTRSFFGKINRKGDIEAVYMHYDGYPENMLPLIQKGYSGSKKKNVDVVLQNGAGSGLEADPKKINYYNDGDEPLTGNVGSIRNFIGAAKDSWAEFIYLYDERDGKWYMADTYEDSDLKAAFESRVLEGNAFGAARAKAIADGKDEFTVDGETYKVTSVDKEDKKNAEEFAGESVVAENYEVIYSDGISAMKKFRTEAQAIDFMKQTIASNKKLRDIAVYKPGMYSTTETDKVVVFWGDGSYLDNVSKKDPKLAAKKLEESAVVEARKPKFWDSMFTMNAIKAWQNGEFDPYDSASVIKWETEQNGGLTPKPSFGTAEVIKYAIATGKKPNGEKLEESVNEAEIKSADEFKEYAFTVLKKAFGEDFDETKAQQVVDGILDKCGDDYGACVGMLQSSLG